MTIDLFVGRRLMLAGSRLGWVWIAASMAALVLIIVLYREERRLISRRAGLFLLSLRLAAAAALGVALFEPIAARSFRETLRGRVIVAVDVSESMATADPGRTIDERRRLVKTLGLEPGSPVERLSRRDVARLLIEPNASISRLAREHAIEAVTFARETAAASLPALAQALKNPARADDPSTQLTDWQPALAEALKAGAGAAPVLGVVLLTDGRQNAPGDPLPTVDRLAARGVPVYPVLIGSTVPPRDAAVAGIKAPESVYRGDVATVAATLKLDGYAGREVAVTLDRPGGSPLRQTVRAPAGGTNMRPVVTFQFPVNEVGTAPFTVALSPLDGDARPDNDRRTVSIQVVDDKASVLLVDGEARWEFRYLRNALARDSRVALKSVVFHQPAADGLLKNTYETALPARPDPAENKPDPLGAFDAVIVGDVDAADLTPSVWTRLESYVAERGGTLILNPGPKHWAMLAGQETARKLLPVLEPHLVSVDPGSAGSAHPVLPPGIAVLPAAAGLDSIAWPMLQLASDPGQNRMIWTGLPLLPWVVAGRAKPGAALLAAADRDDSAAVIAAQPYGLGKVLWVGTDGTWRWRYRAGDAFHHRFWGQVVRWAASRQLGAGNPFVRFGAVKPRVAEGDGVRIQARVSEGIAGAGPDLLIAASLFKPGPTTRAANGEAVAVVPLRPVVGQPRTFEGTAPSLPIGTYVIRLDVPQLAEPLRLDPTRNPQVPQATVDVIARDTSERVELAAAREPLDRLASATRGRVLFDYEAGDLAPLLHARTAQIIRTVESPLWDQPASLLLFFGILTVEWVARKRLGLP